MNNDSIPTESPINQESLGRQNRRLLDHLNEGNTINFLQAIEMNIPYLNSRIAELRKQEVKIYDRFIRMGNIQYKEYSLRPFVGG